MRCTILVGYMALTLLLGEVVISQPLSHMTWRLQARANISAWQSDLFSRTMKMYKENTLRHANGANHGINTLNKFGVEPANMVPNEERELFDLMNATITCPPPGIVSRLGGIEVMGHQDGYKFICNVAAMRAPCLVVSLGSNMDTSFEKAVLDQTPCEVTTFDCTVSNVPSLGPRHKFFQKCIGDAATAAASNGLFVTWQQAVQLSGHTRVEVLKMDIEGYEFDVLSTFTPHDEALPRQIALEIHTYFGPEGAKDTGLLLPQQRVSLAQYALWASHFAHLGYGVVMRDDNPFSLWAAEFLFQHLHSSHGDVAAGHV